MNREELVAAARTAQERAYAPYSHFRVGAALLTATGKVFTGTNIENASYSLTICAERVALFCAVLAGERNFEYLAITSSGRGRLSPCGACLQVLAEFSPSLQIIISTATGELEQYSLREMLPYAFSLETESKS